VDNVLAIDAGSLVSTLARDEQLRIRHVLLTHLHFDHTRDLPTLGLQTLDHPDVIEVHSLPITLSTVNQQLMNGEFYPNLTQQLNDRPPAFRFVEIHGRKPRAIGSYDVQPVDADHPVPTIGYLVSRGGMTVGYTGDTGGPLLPFMQQAIRPDVLFVDVTFPNDLVWRAQASKHLTPNMLRSRIVDAQRAGAALPRIVPVHMSEAYQPQILKELAEVERDLGVDLEPGFEGMELS
jgi:ribonuclease BN (tRNA processing enzyme)